MEKNICIEQSYTLGLLVSPRDLQDLKNYFFILIWHNKKENMMEMGCFFTKMVKRNMMVNIQKVKVMIYALLKINWLGKNQSKLIKVKGMEMVRIMR